MLTDNQYRKLKLLSRKEGRTISELVRSAIDAAYAGMDSIKHRNQFVIQCYKEGFISLGRLAEYLGIDIIDARLYLKKHDIQLGVQESHEVEQDTMNA